MGILGLSSYIREYLRGTLEKHKLHRCTVVIDGNNLAHVLYHDCTGINAAFGGDYDKYASFVEKYFEAFRSCEINAIVIMDGGQPLGNTKLNTVRERIQNQIEHCLQIKPNSQFRMKIFPCMGRDVFVATLKRMGIMVLQTDFEADEEIAAVSKQLGHTVLSNDSDFYMFDVPFVLLESIDHKHVRTEKREGKSCNYISCYRFSMDKFCELTGMNRQHIPILATVLGNDYMSTNTFRQFYANLEEGRKYCRMRHRHRIIRNVLNFMARNKERKRNHVIKNVLELSNLNSRNLRGKITWSMKNYSKLKTNLISCISSKSSIKSSSSVEGESGVTVGQSEPGCATEDSSIETDLILKNGARPPQWFVEAYRENRIPHEVADILTQRYFISPPQVEERSLECSYLVVEPVVRAVYTILWKEVNDKENLISKGEQQSVNSVPHCLESDGIRDVSYHSVTSDAGHDSDVDVIVEEDENENFEGFEDTEGEEISHTEENFEGLATASLPQSWEYLADSKLDNESNLKCLSETKQSESDSDDNMESKTEIPIIVDDTDSEYSLKWYLRKGKNLWLKKLKYLPRAKAQALPYLSEVDSMTVYDRKIVFYSVLESDGELMDLDLPGDLELILAFIIYWFRNSKLPLKDCHVMAVLLCVFMYYIIDGKIGKVRTRKSFEVVDRCKTVVTNLRRNQSYSSPSAGVKDLLANLSDEECLVAGSNLFVFHHMNEKINNKYFNRNTVHAFSEFQACIYFMQMLNSLLCSPFPLLSVEHLWGGTFCYNVFCDLKKRSNPVLRIAEILGRGTCLEKLFLKIFKKLVKVLKFKKCADMVEHVENLKAPKTKKPREKSKTAEDKKDVEGRKGKKKNADQKVSEKSERVKSDKEVFQLLDNRFAGLVVESESDSDDEL